jgi:hypothetical protein
VLGAGGPGVGQLVQAEGGSEQTLDQRVGRLAARAVRHGDALVAEARALGPGGLDDAQDALLSLGHAHTTSRSLANLP